MSQKANFLEADNTLLHSNLRFVRNEMEETFQKYFSGDGNDELPNAVEPPRDYKVITPKPGFCIKSFKVNVHEKFFVNVCIANEIPAPEDITEEQLASILASDKPSTYRIPMSISDPRVTKDKSNNPVDVSDIAINPQFFVKIQKSVLFRDFFLTLITEALNDKYNIQIKDDALIILNNRKFVGTLVQHRVRNNDVKLVSNSYQKTSEGGKQKFEQPQRKLVEELNTNELNELKQKNQMKNEPDYKLSVKERDEIAEEIFAEFLLPKCLSSKEIKLDIGEDRIFLESSNHNYLFDKFFNYHLNQEGTRAIFDKNNKVLQVRIPVLAAK